MNPLFFGSSRARFAAADLRVAARRLTRCGGPRFALTLIEMLVSLVITLVMMAAVVNLFANMSASVRNRRAGIELGGQLRQVRQQLARDLAGATCPAIPWQDPADGVGYFEVIEGQYSDKFASLLRDGAAASAANPELDYATTLIPGSQMSNTSAGVASDAGGLGDYDDVLAFTVRSEDRPFVTQLPPTPQFPNGLKVESTLAEIIWFAVENPASGALGEPGFRTLYRRVLLIAPWLADLPGGLAALNSANPGNPFVDYDISVHFDPTRNQYVPNTLADLTKRENRALRHSTATPFPYAMVTGGVGYSNGSQSVQIARNDGYSGQDAQVDAYAQNGSVYSFLVRTGGQYLTPPTLTVNGGTIPATARPIMKLTGAVDPNSGQPIWTIAHVTTGPAPLSAGTAAGPGRLGADLMLSDALAFDLRVFDPGAPLLVLAGTVLEPADRGWLYLDPQSNTVKGALVEGALSGYGSYVDMGWGWNGMTSSPQMAYPSTAYPVPNGAPQPVFTFPRQAGWHPLALNANAWAGYPCVFDAWSMHYENDGINQDETGSPVAGKNAWQTDVVDQGTNGVDDDGLNGPDDRSERETAPPYDAPLRGLKVILRTYERDSRQIRETSVTQGLVP